MLISRLLQQIGAIFVVLLLFPALGGAPLLGFEVAPPFFSFQPGLSVGGSTEDEPLHNVRQLFIQGLGGLVAPFALWSPVDIGCLEGKLPCW